MSYVIVKTNGAILTTIADGNINTNSTPLGLPGRLYPGYGQVVDTNFVHMLENFADIAPPSNAIKGQLWFNTNTNALCICPQDGETNAANWFTLVTGSSTANFTAGNIAVTGNIDANNLNLTNNLVANLANVNYLKVNIQANIANANVTGNSNLALINTTQINAGSIYTTGNLTGAWTIVGSATLSSTPGTALWVTGGNILATGLKSDYWYYANGTAINFNGTYSNSNVTSYLPTYTGNVGSVGGSAKFNGNVLSTGANTTAGTITGNWTLSAGSKLLGIPSFDGANITGTVANANYSTYAGTVITAAQPNITSVGTLTSLGVSGTVTASTLTSNIASGTAPLTVTSNTKVVNLNADLLDGYNSDISATPSTVVVRDANGNISGNYLIGNGSLLSGLSAALGTVSSIGNGTSNVTVVSSGGNVAVSIAGTSNTAIFTAQGLSVTANVTAGNLNGTLVGGTLSTAAQPNITSLGTLTSLGVNGTLTAVNITSNTGVFTGNGSGLTNLPGANVVGLVPYANYSTYSGLVTISAQPNITSLGTLTGLTSTGNITAPYFIGNVVGNISGNISVTGSNTQVLFNDSGVVGATAGLTFNKVSNLLTVSGNIQATTFVGALSGAATSATTAGTVTTAAQPNITSVGSLTSLIVSGAGLFSGNLGTNSNLNVATNLGVNGNANISGNVIITGDTITGGNSSVTGNVIATGRVQGYNITAVGGVFTGNGAGLTNIPAANLVGGVSYATTAGYATSAGSAVSANSVSGANVTGQVQYASIANSVAGANVTGQVQYASIANSVAGANVTGIVTNATYATSAGSASTVASITSYQVTSALGYTPLSVSDFTNGSSAVYGGTGYWCRLPNGLLLQWGTTVAIKDSYTTVSFPQTFTGQPGVSISGGVKAGDTGAGENPLTLTEVTTTYFKAWQTENANTTAWWTAIGF